MVLSPDSSKTPLYAYERSLRFPNGHRNLIWAKRGVRTLPRTKGEEDGVEGAAKLYEYLRRSNGIVMSHTTATLMSTDWRDNDKELEPLVELYQGDRVSAEYGRRAAGQQVRLQRPSQEGFRAIDLRRFGWEAGREQQSDGQMAWSSPMWITCP